MGLLILAFTLLPEAQAQVYVGGGVTMNPAAIANMTGVSAGGQDLAGPGVMQCVGGQGIVVVDGLRGGGEGRTCRSRGGAMALGGAQLGWQSPGAGTYLTAYTTLGGGVMHLQPPTGGPAYDSAYLFATPTVGVGMPVFGIAAVEASLSYQFNAPLVQQVDRVRVRGRAPGYASIQFSVMFGAFKHTEPASPPVRHVAQHTEVAPAPPPEPVLVAPRGDGTPAPIQPGDALPSRAAAPQETPADESQEAPLALPANGI